MQNEHFDHPIFVSPLFFNFYGISHRLYHVIPIENCDNKKKGSSVKGNMIKQIPAQSKIHKLEGTVLFLLSHEYFNTATFAQSHKL